MSNGPLNPTVIRLEEYKTLRTEILNSIDARFKILAFGIGALAVVLAFTVKAVADREYKIAPAVSLIVIPLLAWVTFHTWVAEVRRGRRASWYLMALERRINKDEGQEVLMWHNIIREGHSLLRVYRDHYWATGFGLWSISVF
jgi:hypothetical protein